MHTFEEIRNHIKIKMLPNEIEIKTNAEVTPYIHSLEGINVVYALPHLKCPVSIEDLERWNLTGDEFHRIVTSDLKKDSFVTIPLEEVVFNNVTERSDMTLKEQLDGLEPETFVILTNPEKQSGANALLSKECMEQIGQYFKEPIYIIPSSQHELLIVNPELGMNAVELKEMLVDVNHHHVDPLDRLSDDLFHYDPNSKILSHGDKVFIDFSLEQLKEIDMEGMDLKEMVEALQNQTETLMKENTELKHRLVEQGVNLDDKLMEQVLER